MERERLLDIAPHIIWPLGFVLPHAPRPAAGLDGARRAVPLRSSGAGASACRASRAVRFGPHPAAGNLKPDFRRGFTYADCWVEDSRLVVLNAMDAAERGADIRTRTRLVSARAGRRRSGRRRSRMRPASARRSSPRALVNAAGPWVGEMLSAQLGRDERKPCAWSRAATSSCPGSMRAITPTSCKTRTSASSSPSPMSSDFTLIGTTDMPYRGRPRHGDDFRRGDASISATASPAISARRSRRPTSCAAIPACGRSTTTTPKTPRR